MIQPRFCCLQTNRTCFGNGQGKCLSVFVSSIPPENVASEATSPFPDRGIIWLKEKNRRFTAIKKNLTELVFILDRSGSMSGLESDTIGGFNSMIEKQKKEPGDALVSTVLFDDRSEVLHDRIPLQEVPKMTDRDYYVRGCTALIDAIGGAVHHISNIHKYAREEDIPEKTVFIITTDGMENASRQYSSREVKKMIEQKQESGWEFLFVGANIDAVETAGKIGIREERAVNYMADKTGTSILYESVSSAVRKMRAGEALPNDWGASMEEDLKKRKHR